MTPRAKAQLNEGTRFVHQWMTIVGFPVLIALVGDMYVDFKRVRENDIRQNSEIEYMQKDIAAHEDQIKTLTQYVFRGIK